MTEPPVGPPTMAPEETTPTGLSPFRQSMMEAIAARRSQPDIAQQVYSMMGLDATNVRLGGVRETMDNLRPGDLVAWGGGDRPDGTYTGNMAIYAGEGQIHEMYFGNVRRRALRWDENVYGLPVWYSEGGEPIAPGQIAPEPAEAAESAVDTPGQPFETDGLTGPDGSSAVAPGAATDGLEGVGYGYEQSTGNAGGMLGQ